MTKATTSSLRSNQSARNNYGNSCAAARGSFAKRLRLTVRAKIHRQAGPKILGPAFFSSGGSSDSSSGLVLADKLSGHKSFLLALAFAARKTRLFLAEMPLFSVLSTEMAVFVDRRCKYWVLSTKQAFFVDRMALSWCVFAPLEVKQR